MPAGFHFYLCNCCDRSVADAVVRAGVPEAAVRLSATGLGRGASARLVE